jgi:hypothetical protein
MLRDLPFTAEQIAAVEVDPDLMLYTLQVVGDRYRRRRKGNAVEDCLTAYIEYYELGLAPDDALEPEDMLAMLALTSRVSAFADVIERGRLVVETDEDRRLPMAEAACSAQLMEKDGKPSFQLLDFLARVERAMPGAR